MARALAFTASMAAMASVRAQDCYYDFGNSSFNLLPYQMPFGQRELQRLTLGPGPRTAISPLALDSLPILHPPQPIKCRTAETLTCILQTTRTSLTCAFCGVTSCAFCCPP